MLKLIFYVPESHMEPVKQAVFLAGAGKIGHYEHCCWQTAGLGQFKPLENSQPFLGQRDVLEKVPEYKIEMVCNEKYLSNVIKALKDSHPYEEPAFDILQLLEI